MVSRMVLVACILAAKMCIFVLEQPSSSIMHFHDRLTWRCPNLFKESILSLRYWMGTFGGDTMKLSGARSDNIDVIAPLLRTMTPAVKQQLSTTSEKTYTAWYDIRDGKIKVDGNPDALKRTQVYPLGYCRTVTHAWLTWRNRQPLHFGMDADESSDSDISSCDGDSWSDCELTPAVQHLSNLCRGAFVPSVL